MPRLTTDRTRINATPTMPSGAGKAARSGKSARDQRTTVTIHEAEILALSVFRHEGQGKEPFKFHQESFEPQTGHCVVMGGLDTMA